MEADVYTGDKKPGYNDDVTVPLSICQPRLQPITFSPFSND